VLVSFIIEGNMSYSVHGEKQRLAAGGWQILSHNIVSSTYLPWTGLVLTTSVVIYIDYIVSSKSNYHTITTTMTSSSIKILLMKYIGRYSQTGTLLILICM